jgi:hypothetical protein
VFRPRARGVPPPSVHPEYQPSQRVEFAITAIIGALLAIPAAATIQIALCEVVAERMRRVEAVRTALEVPEPEQPTDSTHDYVAAETA